MAAIPRNRTISAIAQNAEEAGFEPRLNSRPLCMDSEKAVGAEVLSTIVGFLWRVPSVRIEKTHRLRSR